MMTLPGEGLWGNHLLLISETPSTQSWILDNADDLNHGDVVRAKHQTAGRGRFDRRWLTPPGTCLTFSVLLDARFLPPEISHLAGMAAAVAVCSVFRTIAHGAAVKWPNDVLIDGRKAAGILLERHPTLGHTVLGIGVNVNLSAEQIAAMNLPVPASSLFLVDGQERDMDSFYETVRQFLEISLDSLARDGAEALLRTWEGLDELDGRRITVATAEGQVTGTYAGVAPDGRLRLTLPTGVTMLFWSGDTSIAG